MKKRDDLYLSQILERIELLRSHLKGIGREKFLRSKLHQAAVVRELEVIGEAARAVSEGTRALYAEIPWTPMIGMRNRLIHGYFDVDYDIVWTVASRELLDLVPQLEKAVRESAPPAHPWRPCPQGYYFVRPYRRQVEPSGYHPDGTTAVREHCRRNPSGKDQLYPREIHWMVEANLSKLGPEPKVGKLPVPPNANDYDDLIRFWARYWNDVFPSGSPLDPNLIKALFFSESSFRTNVKSQRVSGRNFARGPMQITDQTRAVLRDEQGEMKDHFLTLTKEDVADPSVALAAAVRWLFYKRDTASQYLKRRATWVEAIADYKGYLRRKKPYLEQKGMRVINSTFAKLRGEG